MRTLVLTALIACGGVARKDGPAGDTASPSKTVATETTEPTDGSTVPATPVVALAPDAPDTTVELVAAATAEGPITWSWTVDGVDAGINIPLVTSDRTARGERWVVRAQVRGADGATAEGKAEVTIGNAPPGGEIAILGSTVGEDLVAVGRGLDPDDDEVVWSYTWSVDGEPAGIDDATVPSEVTGPGQTWQVTAIPHDGRAAGEPLSADVTLVDSPLELSVGITPEEPTSSDELRAEVDARDPDGLPVTLSYRWTIDGFEVGTGTTLDAGFVRDDTVTLEVTATDGLEEVVGESAVVVLNAPPIAASVVVSPSFPQTLDDVLCLAEGTDPDGDPIVWSYSWTVDGLPAGEGDVLPAVLTYRDAVLACTATPSDGLDEGEPVVDEGRVRNTPPTLAEVRVVPDRPATMDEVTVVAVPIDPDEADELTVSWSWTVDGEPAGEDDLSPEDFGEGSLLEVSVTVTDGTGVSDPVVAEARVNRLPVVTLELAPSEVDLALVADWSAVDPDGDPLTETWSWTVDGEPVPADGPSLPGPLEDGARVAVTLRVSDGLDEVVAEAEYLLSNRAPEPPSVRLEPEAPLAGDAVVCIAESAGDPDGDAVSVTARLELNGVVTDQIDWLATALDDTVRCVATATDGALEAEAEAALVVGPPRADNLLVILADDMGTDKVGAYGEFYDPPRTPNIDALASEGVLFRNAYASTVCSPSRANLLTGRHGRRTGLASVIRPHTTDYALPLDEYLLPELVGDVGWSSAVVGKWHLAGFLSDDPGLHPLASGFDTHRGMLGNPDQTLEADDDGGYYEWEYWIDGERTTSRDYLTTVNVDDAIELAATLPEPWVIYVSLGAPHAPYEAPPDELLSEPYDPDIGYWEIFDVMIEAMDTEVGRLIRTIDPAHTTVVFAGDNGTPNEFLRDPWDPDHAKGTIYEPAINVPLIVAGPDVTERGVESTALVHILDVFGTAQHLAGVPTRELPQPVDSVSLLPHLLDPHGPSQRTTLASEWFVPFDGGADPASEMLALRDERFKYVRLWDETFGFVAERLHDLQSGAVEGADLDGDNLLLEPLSPEAAAAYEVLSAAADHHQSLR